VKFKVQSSRFKVKEAAKPRSADIPVRSTPASKESFIFFESRSGQNIRALSKLWMFIVVAVSLLPQAASACSVCFGKSDSDLARGFNWGVLSLLFVVFCVLGAFSVFFIFLAKRSAAMSQNAVSTLADATQKVSNG